MGPFEEFVRYAFPGYALIASVVACLWIVGLLPENVDFYKNFGGIGGAFALVVGPLVGFVIHQIYFIYFDWSESYTKITRKAISFIVHAYLRSKKQEEESLDLKTSERLASQAWILLTTNFRKEFAIDPLYIQRLRSVRNYSHAFGTIIFSSLLAVLIGVAIFVLIDGVTLRSGSIYFLVHLALIALFVHKRRDVMARVDDFELGIALQWKEHFLALILELAELEREEKDVLKLIGRPVA